MFNSCNISENDPFRAGVDCFELFVATNKSGLYRIKTELQINEFMSQHISYFFEGEFILAD